MGGRTDGWMNGWMDEKKHVWMETRVKTWVSGWTKVGSRFTHTKRVTESWRDRIGTKISDVFDF